MYATLHTSEFHHANILHIYEHTHTLHTRYSSQLQLIKSVTSDLSQRMKGVKKEKRET